MFIYLRRTFPASSSNFPLVDVGSFHHWLEVKGTKTSGSSIYFASGHGRDIETSYESTNHSLFSTPSKFFSFNLWSLHIFTIDNVRPSDSVVLWTALRVVIGSLLKIMSMALCKNVSGFYFSSDECWFKACWFLQTVLEDFFKYWFCCWLIISAYCFMWLTSSSWPVSSWSPCN